MTALLIVLAIAAYDFFFVRPVRMVAKRVHGDMYRVFKWKL